MESYKSKCIACNSVYTWVGYKTGLGKSLEQLLEMAKQNHTCRACGSKLLVTGCDWGGDPKYEATQNYNADPAVLTDYEWERAEKKYSDIDTTQYSCDKCDGTKYTVITHWKDTDGDFMVLYCHNCKKRFAVSVK